MAIELERRKFLSGLALLLATTAIPQFRSISAADPVLDVGKKWALWKLGPNGMAVWKPEYLGGAIYLSPGDYSFVPTYEDGHVSSVQS